MTLIQSMNFICIFYLIPRKYETHFCHFYIAFVLFSLNAFDNVHKNDNPI